MYRIVRFQQDSYLYLWVALTHTLLDFKGKSPDDDVRLSALNLKPNTKIMMMGTREENLVWSYFVFAVKRNFIK